MKKIVGVILILISINLKAQIYDPVSWTFTQKNISETEIELQFTANIQEGWYLYS